MTRKSPMSLIQALADELVKNGPKTTNEIATAMNSSTKTVKKWLDIIEKCQSIPKITIERAKNITLVRLEGKKEN